MKEEHQCVACPVCGQCYLYHWPIFQGESRTWSCGNKWWKWKKGTNGVEEITSAAER